MAVKSSMELQHNFAFYLHETLKRSTKTESLIVPVYEDSDCTKELIIAQKSGSALPKHYSASSNGIFSVDFLKASYFQLPSDYQKEYTDVIRQIMRGDTLVDNKFFDDNFRDFNLSDPKFYKTWVKLCTARINFEAKIGKKSFEEVVKMLEDAQQNDENIVIYYKEYAIFSELDDKASAYLKVYGETEEEHKKNNNGESEGC